MNLQGTPTKRDYLVASCILTVALGGCQTDGSAASGYVGNDASASDGSGSAPADGDTQQDARGPEAGETESGSSSGGSGGGPEAGADGSESGANSSPVPNGPSGPWTLVWHDEFDGQSLDDTKWNSGWLTPPRAPGQGDTTAVTDSQQSGTYFGPSAFIFPGDGALHIRLTGPIDHGASGSLESGLITTAGLWNINPSSASYSGAGQSINGTQVIEIRARLAGPTANGGAYWPAFWMTNAGNYNTGGENYTEEVDLLEGLGNGSIGNALELHLHAASEYGGVLVVPSGEKNTDFSLAYHTYTYYLSSTKIQCWNDGTLVSDVNPSSSQVSAQWGVPQYLMLAFQATSGADHPTSATGSPNDLMLDYVRIWTN